MTTTHEPFIRYIVKGPSFSWWEREARPYLEKKGWLVIDPSGFEYESSYGFDPNVNRNNNEVRDMEYYLKKATSVVEYHGDSAGSSVFDPNSERTIIDDLLAFMSLYTGTYAQYLWRERRRSNEQWQGAVAMQLNYGRADPEWAARREQATGFFENALTVIPSLNRTPFDLAIRWFFSAIRELEVGRPLVEAALNWVVLEAQANSTGILGNKFKKVETLLNNQGFPSIPRLRNFYQLRNDAFHDGALSNLSESDAQAAHIAGRALARAQILNLLGMDHSDFAPEFVRRYD